MRGRALGAAALAAVAVTGCGSSGSKSKEAHGSTATTSAHQTPTISQPSEQNGRLDQVRQRLQAAGLTPEDEDASGTSVDALVANDVHVIGYRNTSDTAEDARGIKKALDSHPGRGLIKVVKTRIYWTGEEHTLSAKEKATFAKVFTVGEGKK